MYPSYRFGNFLCNNISERRKLSVPTLTVSLWAHLKAVADSFKNPTYKEYSEVRPVSSELQRCFLFLLSVKTQKY